MVDVAEVKANQLEMKPNQLEIKAMLDLLLQFEKKVDLLLEILSKKDEKKEEQGGSSALDELLDPPSVDLTPPRSSVGPLIVYQSPPSVHKVPASEIENVSFKRRKLVNTKLKDFTNSFGKQFKVNDPYGVDPLCPYDKDQFQKFNKWLEGKVDNKKPIELGVNARDMAWFLELKTPGKWLNYKVRIC